MADKRTAKDKQPDAEITIDPYIVEDAVAAPLGTEAELGISPDAAGPGGAYSPPLRPDPIKTDQDQAGFHIGDQPQGQMTPEKVEAHEMQQDAQELDAAVDEKS